ncbi:MAG: carboxylesterase/lipase family protein [Cupriavidus necator]
MLGRFRSHPGLVARAFALLVAHVGRQAVPVVFNVRTFAQRLFVIAVSGWLLVACGGSDSDPTVVSTDKGSLMGVETASTLQFLGIPYAAPPTGSARWVAPQAAASWRGVRDASKFGPHCPQPDTPFGRASNTSEDCLYLNVYRPKGNGPFPVMVWIHGGALFLGESDDYDPSQLVGQGVVVVTINYRLGALGFLAHASLSAEAAGSSGNYGIMDQQAALNWVQSNIAAFGGDSNNVTVFGESAGGHSVHTHLASPLSAGLFHKAIIESGSYSLDTPSLQTAQSQGENFATAAGCTDQSAACLRSLTLAQILANQSAIITGAGVLATVDNKVLTQTHRAAFATGNFNRVPVIEGSNGHEFSLISAFFFDFTAPPTGLGPVTAANYPTAESLILSFYDARKTVADVDAVYPVASYLNPVDAIDAIGTDSAYSCPARNSVQAMSNYTTVFQYEFNDPNAPMIYLPASPSHPTWGAYHASEMQYLFKVTPSIPSPRAFDRAQQDLSRQMVGFWAQFAKTGNPNAMGSSLWPQYTATTDTAMSLDPTGVKTTTDFAARHRCMFWTGL